MRWLALSALLAAFAASAHAQGVDDPEARINPRYLEQPTVLEGLTVKAGRPAWWIVSHPSSPIRVHVLGIPWAWPSDTYWSQSDLEALLGKTNLVVIPPALAETRGRAGDRLPDVGSIPAELHDRISAAAAKIGAPADRYLTAHPLIAGYLLVTDFRAQIGFEEEGVLGDVLDVAEARRPEVLVVSAGVRTPATGARAFRGLRPAGARTCLEAALAEVELGEEAARAAVRAWRSGYIRSAVEAPRSLDICAFAIPELASLRRSGIGDTSAAIRSIINGRYPQRVGETRQGARLPPSQTDYVVLVYLRSLLAEDGVLDRLASAGFKIKNPSAAVNEDAQQSSRQAQ